MNRLRFGILMAALGVLLLVGVPFRVLAQRAGWRLGSGVTVWFHKILCAALGVRIRVHGEFPAPGGALIAANHVSWLDIPVLGALQPVAFLAKKEVGQHWIARALVKLQGVIFVDRQRRRCIPAVNQKIAQELASGGSLALFAEATTGDGNRLLPFRSSHFEALRDALGARDHVRVQSLYIAYVARNGLPLGRAGQPLAAWYGDMTFAGHFSRFLLDGPFDCEMTFGAPICFFRTSNRKEIALQVQTSVRELAGRQRRTRLRVEVPMVAAPPSYAPPVDRKGEGRLIELSLGKYAVD
jgi:lyso-ornithine lipid O-acyltransferase